VLKELQGLKDLKVLYKVLKVVLEPKEQKDLQVI
jgi:hypothetical protein